MTTINNVGHLKQQAMSPEDPHSDGRLTIPRSYGVYALPESAKATKRFRYGNHPIRGYELTREFGTCRLEALFRERSLAKALADTLASSR